MTQTNIDYWEQVLKNPTDKYSELFDLEREYLQKNIGSNESVLDIGCGDGRNILSLLSITTNIVGLDIDEKAVKDATENLKEFPNIKIVQGSVFNLPFEDNIFKNVVLSMTLVNLGDSKKKALEEMKRVVTTDGKIIVSAYSEKALENRLAMYEKIKLPIHKISEQGEVTFDESLGAHTSEQFSLDDICNLATSVGLKIVDHREVSDLAYIVTLVCEIK